MRTPLAPVFAAMTLSACALAVDVGHVDDFTNADDLADFSGGSFLSNPGTGGVGGDDDGFLRVENLFNGHFGTRSASAPYIGDWNDSGAQGISFWIKNLGTTHLEMHLGIGSSFTWFQHNTGHVATPEWTKVIVTFDNPPEGTPTQGSGSFSSNLDFCDRINIRHDLPPFVQSPNNTTGVLGIDRIKILGPCPGDANRDFVVSFLDLNAVLSSYGTMGANLEGDVNDDGVVDFLDLNEVLSSFGVDCTAP